MNENKANAKVLEVVRHSATAYLRVTGRATFTIGPALKQFGAESIAAGCTRIVLDAAACESMDSTFMGALAGMATRLARQNKGKMLIVNAPDKLFDVLITLGLNQLMECRRLGTAPEPIFEPPLTAAALAPLTGNAASVRATRDVMLEAHQDLAAVSKENELRFKDVLTYLQVTGDQASGNLTGQDAPTEPDSQ